MGERRPILIRSTLVVALALAAGAGSTAAQSAGLGAYHALVIGNQAYRQLRPLTTPVADAGAVADLLRRDYGFANVQMLTNATRAEMVRALDGVRKTLRENDNLVIYYAGHGWLDREADRGYWLPVNAEPEGRANWLSNSDITDTLRALKAKHVLVVADTCYSGTLTRSIGIQPLAAPDILRLAQKKARTVLTSGGLEPVADVGGGAHSVFAKAFLEVLRGNQGAADLASLFSAIRRQVLLSAEQTPEYADLRQAGHDGGDFIFVRPGAKLAAVPPEPARAPAPPTITQELGREYGSLAIRAKLPGVEVWLDERKIGETESGKVLVLSNLTPGTYRVEARKDQRDWMKVVQVTANQRAEVMIDIEALREDDGAEIVLVPVGAFWMGSDTEGGADEKPRRRVTLGPYYIDRYEVTNALYKRFLETTSRAAPLYWTDTRFNAPTQPVVGVSWRDADAYCKWAGKQLPTESEWEKAARGTDGRKYPWGNPWDASRANSRESNLGQTAPVGSYPSGVSPYGAHDMAGNVSEWVATSDRVVRGGSWVRDAFGLRATARDVVAGDGRGNSIGFRCARESHYLR